MSAAVWPQDRVVRAAAVDDFMETCMASAGCHLLEVSAQLQPSRSRGEDKETAWATTLPQAGHSSVLERQVQALSVLGWSARRADAVDRTFLVLCGETTSAAVRNVLRRRGFVVVAVPSRTQQQKSPAQMSAQREKAVLRLHLWRLTEFRRIVYVDIDSLVLAPLAELFELPAEVSLAATVSGPDADLYVDDTLISLAPSYNVFQKLSDICPASDEDRATSTGRESMEEACDVAFFSQLLGARNQSLSRRSSRCGQNPGQALRQARRASPWAMCLLDRTISLTVPFHGLSDRSTWEQAACSAAVRSGCQGGLGVRVLHLPGGRRWQPWALPTGADAYWAYSVIDYMWQEAKRQADLAGQLDEVHGVWREDERCGSAFRTGSLQAHEAECNPEGENSCCNPETGWCGSTPSHCSCTQCIDYSASLRDTSVLFEGRLAAVESADSAILILARLDSLGNVRKLARLLRGVRSCRWLMMRNTPLYIMYDSNLYPPCASGPQSAACRPFLGDWGDFVRYLNVTDYLVVPEKFRHLTSVRGFPLSYAAMCEFWTATVFQVPEVRRLRYFMRLDADATITCAPGAPDAFEELRITSAHYGYYVLGRDEAYVSEGYAAHLRSYLSDDRERISKLVLEDAKDQAVAELEGPMFYDNFEVVDVQFFLSESVQRYTAAFLAADGIYLKRWGDALARYGQLVAGSGRALCLQSAYGYCHDRCCMVNAGNCSYPLGGCEGLGGDARLLQVLRWDATGVTPS
eukprot:TRINITY_DN40025_c0_g1_i3.p1 TRINITY_DN40025_c0_g1~~TRINITY_DN40025_c0_g1_i3.p1  ORF type:complete len:876 (+),score=77.25 TRINITY_DN40025_c0_g1_i3:385-2628(+)